MTLEIIQTVAILLLVLWCAVLRDEAASLRRSLGKTNGRVIDMRAWTAADLAEQRHRAQAPRRRGQDLPTQRDGSAS